MKPSKRTESPQKRYIFEKAQNDPLHTLHLFRNEDGLFLGNYGNYSAATGTLCVLADGKLLEILPGNAFKGYLEIIYSSMDQEIFINIETAGLEFQRLYLSRMPYLFGQRSRIFFSHAAGTPPALQKIKPAFTVCHPPGGLLRSIKGKEAL